MYKVIKRGFCVFASILGILGTSPLWILAVIGIELSDPGPVFFMANRVGKDNKTFKMFKFRSMRIDKNANESSLRADQSRIFPFGEFIRASKIDELPQLINCLKGDMAIIGPRPASVDQVKITRGGENVVVSSIKPGLSGPSALYDYIYGDNITDEVEYERLVLPTRLALDRYYVNHVGCLFDLKMIWWTVLCIVCSFNHETTKTTSRILDELEGYVK